MPYIELKTNKKIENATELKELFGKLIEIIPGKSESWLMLNFIDECKLAFKGDMDTPCAIAEVKIFGAAADTALDKFTSAATEKLSELLNIPGDRIYIKYEFCNHWGYNGFNF